MPTDEDKPTTKIDMLETPRTRRRDPDQVKTPPDLYTRSDRVEVEIQIQKLGTILERGIESISTRIEKIDARMDGFEARTGRRASRIATVATVAVTLASGSFLLVVMLAAFWLWGR